MKILIAIVTCHRFRARADLVRHTWAAEVGDKADVRYFFGTGALDEPWHDEVRLNVPDDYPNLRLKVQRVCAWAVEQGYDFIFKTDDDVYVIPERLFASFTGHDYCGRVRAPSRENDAPRIYGNNESCFCSGFGYFLSQRAARIVANASDNGDWAEDRFVGNVLAQVGIRPVMDQGMKLWPPLYGHFCSVPNEKCTSCIQQYNGASVICPYARPDAISTIHRYYTEKKFVPTWLE